MLTLATALFAGASLSFAQTPTSQPKESLKPKIEVVAVELHDRLIWPRRSKDGDRRRFEKVKMAKEDTHYLIVFLRLSTDAPKEFPVRWRVPVTDGVTLVADTGETYPVLTNARQRDYGKVTGGKHGIGVAGKWPDQNVLWVFEIPREGTRKFTLKLVGQLSTDQKKLDDLEREVRVIAPQKLTNAPPPNAQILGVVVREEPYLKHADPKPVVDLEVPEGKVFWEVKVRWMPPKIRDFFVLNTTDVSLLTPDGKVIDPTGEVNILNNIHGIRESSSSAVRKTNPVQRTYVFAVDPELNKAALRFATREVAKIKPGMTPTPEASP